MSVFFSIILLKSFVRASFIIHSILMVICSYCSKLALPSVIKKRRYLLRENFLIYPYSLAFMFSVTEANSQCTCLVIMFNMQPCEQISDSLPELK